MLVQPQLNSLNNQQMVVFDRADVFKMLHNPLQYLLLPRSSDESKHKIVLSVVFKKSKSNATYKIEI